MGTSVISQSCQLMVKFSYIVYHISIQTFMLQYKAMGMARYINHVRQTSITHHNRMFKHSLFFGMLGVHYEASKSNSKFS